MSSLLRYSLARHLGTHSQSGMLWRACQLTSVQICARIQLPLTQRTYTLSSNFSNSIRKSHITCHHSQHRIQSQQHTFTSQSQSQSQSQGQGQVRVRYAPSPTGYLHLGGLRTALYNYLFAKQHNGSFVLRIEDTDQKRFVEGASEKLSDTLDWAGIPHDEGPGKTTPDSKEWRGPYTQSQRTELYREHARKLIDSGDAYYCFCTAERLDRVRNAQRKQGLATVYDRACVGLSKTDVEQRLEQPEKYPYVVRLKIPYEPGVFNASHWPSVAGSEVGSETTKNATAPSLSHPSSNDDSDNSELSETIVEDAVRGMVRFNNRTVDDQVLMKSDGFPTYHLASVVDDHMMGITHVIRGEEWLPSTVKHVLLYRAFNWPLPTFYHLPLLLDASRQKLSKRHGDASVDDFVQQGFLPEALLNFVALLGWNSTTDQVVYTMSELLGEFDISRVQKGGAIVDRDRLEWLNSQHIRRMMQEDMPKLIKIVSASLLEKYQDRTDIQQSLDDERVSTIIELLNQKVRLIPQFAEYSTYFFDAPACAAEENKDALNDMWIAMHNKAVDKPACQPQSLIGAVRDALGQLTDEEFEQMPKQDIGKMLKSIIKEAKGGQKALFFPLRFALTGMRVGADLSATIKALGRQRSVEWLTVSLEQLKGVTETQ
jgi:glutamyl-tRNA synthetase